VSVPTAREVQPPTDCGCVGAWHLDTCERVVGPMRRYAEGEFAAWQVYAAATEAPRRAYAQALKEKTKVFHQVAKETKAGMGPKVSLYQMVMRMDELMAPPMKAYVEATAAERKGYFDIIDAETRRYRAATSSLRRELEAAIVNFPDGLTPDQRLQGITLEDLLPAAPLPEWLPKRARLRTPVRKRSDKLAMKWLPRGLAVLVFLTAASLLIRDPWNPVYWTFGAFLVGAGFVTLQLGKRGSALRFTGPAIMAGGGVGGLALGVSPAAAALCIGGALAIGGVELAFARMMRGFPER
jgi:hypothetical protein